MRFKDFIKEKLLIITLLFFGIVTIEIFLLAYQVDNFIKIYILIIILGIYFIAVLYEYFKKKNFYNKIQKILEELDEKYLITEIRFNEIVVVDTDRGSPNILSLFLFVQNFENRKLVKLIN